MKFDIRKEGGRSLPDPEIDTIAELLVLHGIKNAGW